MHGGLQLGPPGRFWDDSRFAKAIGLRKEQQKKMDAVFNANKAVLYESYKALKNEEKQLAKITRERPLEESRVFAGIDAVVQARGRLEKANAHMLLLIRQLMEPEQITTMDQFRDAPPESN